MLGRGGSHLWAAAGLGGVDWRHAVVVLLARASPSCHPNHRDLCGMVQNGAECLRSQRGCHNYCRCSARPARHPASGRARETYNLQPGWSTVHLVRNAACAENRACRRDKSCLQSHRAIRRGQHYGQEGQGGCALTSWADPDCKRRHRRVTWRT